jgi:hypothetical protein
VEDRVRKAQGLEQQFSDATQVEWRDGREGTHSVRMGAQLSDEARHAPDRLSLPRDDLIPAAAPVSSSASGSPSKGFD